MASAETPGQNEPISWSQPNVAVSQVLERLTFPGVNSSLRNAVSIEYSHIYQDELPGSEQSTTAFIAAELASTLRNAGWEVRLDVLLDDYNVENRLLTSESLVSFLTDLNVVPDTVASEAALVPLAIENLKTLGKVGKSARQYVSQRQRVPCSALIANWYACRLGIRSLPENFLLHGSIASWESVRPTYLINILHSRYDEVETLARPLLGLDLGQSGIDRILTIYPDDSFHEDSRSLDEEDSIAVNE